MVWHKVTASAADYQSPVRHPSRLRARTLALVSGAAAVGALCMIVLSMGAATAQVTATPTTTPPPTFIDSENTVACDDPNVNLDGTVLFSGTTGGGSGVAGSGTIAAGILTVTIVAGWEASGIVVKGGNAFNLYTGPFTGPIVVTGMQPPDNPSGGPAGFSHWFVCGESTTTTPTPTTPSTTTTTATTTTATTTTLTTPPTTTTTPGLPVTGASLGGLIAAGLALVGAGVALVFLRRRRDITGTPAA